MRPAFHTYLIASFFLGLVGGVVGLNLYYLRSPNNPSPLSHQERAGIPSELLRPRPSQSGALREKFWWLSSSDDLRGMAVDLKNSPAHLVKNLFPGYPESMAHDTSLWNRYFSEDYSAQVRTPELGAAADTILNVPSLGCLDIYRHYGGDVLILGNSQTASNLVPSQLQRELGSDYKILNCTRSGAVPHYVSELSSLLKEDQTKSGLPRFKKVILGYTLWWTYPRWTYILGAEKSMQQSIDRRKNHRDNGISLIMQGLGFAPFAAASWQSLVKANYEERLNLVTPERRIAADAVPPGKFFQPLYSHSVAFDKSDRPQLKRILASAKPYFFDLDIEPEVRDKYFAEGEVAYNQMIDKLLEISDEVYVYLAPVSPFRHDDINQELKDRTDRLLHSRASIRVHGASFDFSSYQLNYDDFIVTAGNDRTLILDAVHTNHLGAEKVTSRIARWTKGGLK